MSTGQFAEDTLDFDIFCDPFEGPSAATISTFIREQGWASAHLITAVTHDRPSTMVECRFLVTLKDSERAVPRVNSGTDDVAYDPIEDVLGKLAALTGSDIDAWFGNEWCGVQAPTAGSRQAPMPAADANATEHTAQQVPRKSVFIAYGDAFGSTISTPETVSFAHEVSRDIKVPITAVAHESKHVAFALENFSDYPTWVDRFPIIELISNNGIQVRWHSKSRPKGKRATLFGGFGPRYSWHLQEAQEHQIITTPHTALPSAHENSATLQSRLAQITREWQAELGPNETDLSEAQELAGELGLSTAQARSLSELLNGDLGESTTEQLCELLGLPQEFARAFEGTIEPSALPGSVTVDRGTFTGEINLRSLIERPTGNKFGDRMRQLDFDRPVLALVMELSMVLAGFALIWAGIDRWEVFETSWIRWVGYLGGAWLLVDGLASIWTWSLIRRRNIKSVQDTPKS